MYNGPVDRDQPDNLYEPVAGHRLAHGAFDARARSSSWELQLTLGAGRMATALSDLAGEAFSSVLERGQQAIESRSNGRSRRVRACR
jgi:hypothetical protein